MMEPYFIGIDIGGTRIKGVLLSGEIISESIYIPTGEGELFKAAVKRTIEELSVKSPSLPIAIGLSAPGIPDKKNEAIAVMPGRLPGLEGFIWSNYLERPTAVLNDAVCALLAEARVGSAVGY